MGYIYTMYNIFLWLHIWIHLHIYFYIYLWITAPPSDHVVYALTLIKRLNAYRWHRVQLITLLRVWYELNLKIRPFFFIHLFDYSLSCARVKIKIYFILHPFLCILINLMQRIYLIWMYSQAHLIRCVACIWFARLARSLAPIA